MPHGDEVRLAGAARAGSQAQIDAVGATIEGRLVRHDADAGGLVGVYSQVNVFAQ